MNLYQPTISGSLTVSGSVIVDGTIVMTSGSISGTASLAENSLLLNNLNSGSFVGTGSYNTFSGSVSSRLVTQENASASFAAQSSSLSTRVTNLEVTTSVVSSSFATTSGSLSERVTIIEGQDATTGSNTFTGVQYVSQASNAISFTSTASLYTDGGLRVAKDSFVSGTAYFNNITVYGTSSIQYITSSQVNIGTNIITVNTDTPAVRFGGLSVFDSGSTQLTGSILWDSQNNHWIYSNPSGSSYNSAMLMNGPRNTGSLGNEQGTTLNALMKGQGGDHITSSQMIDDGTTVRIPGNLQVTGSTIFTGALTLGSTISNGTFTYTLPSATGTLALTSNLSAYLPLTGGTLTGTLNGTSATFSGNGAFSGVLQVAPTTATGMIGVGDNFGGGMNAGIYRGGLGVTTAGNYLNIGGYDGVVITTGNAALGSQTTRLTIASTGAATFSSSVTANGTVILGSNSSSTPYALGTSTARFQLMNGGVYGLAGDVLTNGNTYLQSQRTDGNTAAYNLLLQPLGGNVGIGTSSPTRLLDVNGVIRTQNAGSAGAPSIELGTSAQGNGLFYPATNTIAIATNDTERMRITSGGQIGIGITPTGTWGLQMYGNGTSSAVARIQLQNSSTGGADGDGGGISMEGIDFVTRNNESGVVKWELGGTERMRITSAGNVEIGNASRNSFTYLALINDANTNGGVIAIARSAGQFLNSAGAGDMIIGNSTGENILFGNSQTGTTEYMRITSGGNVLMGKTSTGAVLNNGFEFNPSSNYISSCSSVAADTSGYFANTATSGTRFLIRFYGTSSEVGRIQHDGTNTSYVTSSDYRLKEDLKEVSGLDKVLAIKIYDFKWKNSDNRMDGVIAHELAEVLPYAVSGDKDEVEEDGSIKVQGVDYSKLVPVLVKAIQEQQQMIEELKALINK